MIRIGDTVAAVDDIEVWPLGLKADGHTYPAGTRLDVVDVRPGQVLVTTAGTPERWVPVAAVERIRRTRTEDSE